MMQKILLAATTAAALALAGAASAATITFDGQSGSATSYTEAGVTFTPVGGGVFSFTGTPNGTNGLLGEGSPRQTIRADISGGATSVSVDLGDYGADDDQLFLSIFDAFDVLLGQTQFFFSSSIEGMQTLTASAPGIAYAVMGSTAPSLNGSSVYVDNFTYESAGNAVPEPATWALMIGGFGAAGLMLRRRKAALA